LSDVGRYEDGYDFSDTTSSWFCKRYWTYCSRGSSMPLFSKLDFGAWNLEFADMIFLIVDGGCWYGKDSISIHDNQYFFYFQMVVNHVGSPWRASEAPPDWYRSLLMI
jgi:hypothetical protein